MTRLMIVLPSGELKFIKGSEFQIIQSLGGIGTSSWEQWVSAATITSPIPAFER